MALRLLFHTFRMIFGNLGQALKVSIGPFVVLVLGITALFFVATTATGDSLRNLPFLMLFIFPLVLFVTAWVAVSWHRFILLEEYAGILPAVSDRPIWSYAGKAILLGFIIILIAVPLFYIIGATGLAAAFTTMSAVSPDFQSNLFITLVILVAVLVFISFISLRLGISLVGTALAKQLSFGQAWTATRKISGTILGVAVLLVLLNTIPQMLLSTIGLVVPMIAAVLNIMLSWLTTMLGISILTTIYGHVIEDRPLIG